ncbi:hypothetical protein [Dechloromonas agitata]|uniref:hypothetical protein n=1 Tax=Dechloromonas agitata TaxID=73030 RepID=UPI0004874466|nr:hypothetical protein [Dechloromonas agitata]
MADIPEDDLAESRAALAPLLEATAAILPWLAKPKPPRFAPRLNERWISACQRLHQAWQERHGHTSDVRPAVYNLYAIALETADADCLRLGEALASATDRLDDETPPVRLIAALSASIETLREPDGLEHEAFGERARHFAARLENAAAAGEIGERSTVLDQLFVDEAREQLELLRDALAALPPDAYVLTTEALKLAQQAETLEIWGIMHLARQLADCITRHGSELDQPAVRAKLTDLLRGLEAGINAVVI